MDVIIGGGLAGLTAGIDLARPGREVKILEKAEVAGGLASSYQSNGYIHDTGFHQIIPDAVPLYEMAELAGIKDDLIHFDMKFGFMKDGQVHPFSPAPLSFVKFDLLSATDKAKFGMLMKTIGSFSEEHHSGTSAEKFVKENISVKAFDSFFEPLLSKLSGLPPEKLSAAFFIAFCKLMVKVKNFDLCYPRNGIGELANGMVSHFRSLNGDFETGSEVKEICTDGTHVKRVVYSTEDEEKEIEASTVVSTVPFHELGDIVDLPREYGEKLKKLISTEFMIAYFGMDGKLSGYDMEVMIPRSEGLCFNSFTEVSNIAEKVAPPGKSLLNVVTTPHRMNNGSDEKVLDAITYDMNRIFPGFDRKIKWRILMRRQYPAITKEFISLKPGFVTPVGGLYLAGAQMFLIPDMPTAIVSGHIVSEMILGK